ncbi:hypothetical protein JOF53_007120 [Crossiella equi]|uniref:Uncharacterized protein n=1 Tax=Crossiella equi TaxID=130796 RepID=A0ABS5ANV8_9PSEU|nr:hypothetical protein [Crossiella equi]MBP2478248.1 hypothetical protein [Crossiella equi]
MDHAHRLTPGDVVVAYSPDLGEWTAAQITGVNEKHRSAEVLELTWSGPEPRCLAELGELVPLRLTHHDHPYPNRPAHTWLTGLLPRGHRVLGNLPPLVTESTAAYFWRWDLGLQLDCQRQWDAGHRGERPNQQPYATHDSTALPGTRDERLRTLSVTVRPELDCALLPELFPNLTSLSLTGALTTLTNAAALSRLPHLRDLGLSGVYGMTGADVPRPADLPDLAWLRLHGIPADYAKAARRLWQPEERNGTFLEIRWARTPDWLAENRDNPLRSWDGNIPAAAYKKAIAQYKLTRRAVLAALPEGPARLTELGREYAEAFNTLHARWNFIETIEREDLLDALQGITDETWAQEALAKGMEAARDW